MSIFWQFWSIFQQDKKTFQNLFTMTLFWPFRNIFWWPHFDNLWLISFSFFIFTIFWLFQSIVHNLKWKKNLSPSEWWKIDEILLFLKVVKYSQQLLTVFWPFMTIYISARQITSAWRPMFAWDRHNFNIFEGKKLW